MKPSKFEYYRPKTVESALSLLDESGFDGKILAGGQSLVPIMNMRLSTPDCLIDINHISDLDFIEFENETIKIGTLTRQSRVEASSLIKEKSGLLGEAVPFIGHVQTRNRGTFGGSLVHADPSAEIPLSLMASGGSILIASTEETRKVEVEDFFVTYLTTDLMPTELLTEVHIPVWEGRVGYSFNEISRRHGDFALVAAACQLALDDQNKISRIRLALGGVEAVPLLVEEANNIMCGEQISESLLEKVADIVADAVDPESDLHASADYRRHLAAVLTKRTLESAYTRARRST
ncbi:FAD binding domain-containing protein [Peribacillus sp. SCS-37]|uniref:FAD binding domain-containing protein n=1 Tax=Paraperibacillus esterisolvens TaxID=3115296 RepID=UPI003905F8CC